MSRMAEQQLYIDGGYVSATSGKTFETINPASGECWRPSRPPAAKTSTGR
ncbi:betaine aldehyde dehydrogenase [Klebsiella michiganensis]|uniref:Betaine aldehyde dehydrogenase n=1 Tax=Klebsiella michiganensis TaxID=1134687 RepID=A0A7H4LXS1_9ENTR|nr:betaine aldehyde dehydrogenase [Klebsiella michiganensis]